MESAFDARRLVRSYRQAIDATPAVVFPLLCPVRETEWLEGWAYRMNYSACGLVEQGAVFTTSRPGEPDTVWVVSRLDASSHVVEFCRFTPGSRTCLLKIVVSPRGTDGSWVDVSYEYTSIAPAGNDFLETWTDAAFLRDMRFWEASMNHFLETGARLERAEPPRSDAPAASPGGDPSCRPRDRRY